MGTAATVVLASQEFKRGLQHGSHAAAHTVAPQVIH